jgi:hypothetical protein
MATPFEDQQARITHAMNAVADAVRVVEAFETKHIVQPTLDDIGDMLRAAELVEATNRIGDRYGHGDYESPFDVIHRAVADGDADALFLIAEHTHFGAAA